VTVRDGDGHVTAPPHPRRGLNYGDFDHFVHKTIKNPAKSDESTPCVDDKTR
jgi:hypothetical protein